MLLALCTTMYAVLTFEQDLYMTDVKVSLTQAFSWYFAKIQQYLYHMSQRLTEFKIRNNSIQKVVNFK